MVDLVAKDENVKTVLFLCTGNYYRSRFAEELFNHEAARAGLDWIAQSRGLALERGANNVGPIASVVLHALKELTISARGADRFPQQCTVDDLAGADFVVAVKETEHRPLMRERFAEWEHRLDYWKVHDVGDAAPAEALKVLAREVRTLLLRLRGRPTVQPTRIGADGRPPLPAALDVRGGQQRLLRRQRRERLLR
jgi:protein-tyrosine phosphatase